MNIKIFLPDFMIKSPPCFFRGHHIVRNEEHILYVTSTSELCGVFHQEPFDLNSFHGRFGNCSKLYENSSNSSFDVDFEDYSIRNVILDGRGINTEQRNVIVILYDYTSFSLAENWTSSDEVFRELHNLVSLSAKCEDDAMSSVLSKSNILWLWLLNLQFFVQLENFITSVSWLYKSLKKNKKITLKCGNIMTALLTDITIGCLLLMLLDVRSQHYTNQFMIYIEGIVNYLRSLLKWLMGAPAGLKLNTAFTNMLGKFFLYHIDLWWKFLDLSKGCLRLVSMLYYYFGFLGVTFQAAIVSDMILFVSFHAYCIYVYIARLFNIKMRGLAALLRLFVGRKRNPLRGGVDSCEYTNQELFVGTLAFTVLLFLLPTSAVYYIVFVLFRVLLLAVKGLLARLCYFIKTLPLYVVFLCLIKSPRIAGKVHMEVVREATPDLPLVLSVRLGPRSPSALVSDTTAPPDLRCAQVLKSVLNGTLIT